MVLDLDSEPLFSRAERRPLRDGPAAQHATDLKAEVVMPRARVMQLHYKVACLRLARSDLAARFRGFAKVTFALIFLQAHWEPPHGHHLRAAVVG